ncbi:MAG: two-component regulator propeller domain-containing protein [Chitinophagaceae bacterium]
MKKYFYQTQAFTFLTIIIFGTACNGQVKKDLPKETEHPKLIKTIGSPRYGNVQCAIQDKAGNLWFGTTENGLYKYDGKSFTRFLVTDGLSSNNINCLLEDKDGKIWIGTPEGLCLYDDRLNDEVGQGKIFVEIRIPLPKNLPTNKNRNTHDVFSIMQAKSGKLWFATIDGVYIYDGKSFTPFIIDEGAMGYMSTNNNAERILEDKAGNIWFGGRGTEGVYRYDGKSVTNIKLKELFQDGPKPKAHNWAWPQWQDKNGNIWFSNWGGAYRYDGKSFTSFTTKDGLNNLARIIEDKKGNIWFGGAGLSRYDGKSFTPFTTKDGLPNLGVWSILEDKTGNLWVGTRETGLYLYDGKTFITYSEYK